MDAYFRMLNLVPEINRRNSIDRFINVLQNSNANQSSSEREPRAIPNFLPNLSLRPSPSSMNVVDQETQRERNIIPSRQVDSLRQKERIYSLDEVLKGLYISCLPKHIKEEFCAKYENIKQTDILTVQMDILNLINNSTTIKTNELFFNIKLESEQDFSAYRLNGFYTASMDKPVYLHEDGVSDYKLSGKHWIQICFIKESGKNRIAIKEGSREKNCMISVQTDPQPLKTNSEFFIGKYLFNVRICGDTLWIYHNGKQMMNITRSHLTFGRAENNMIRFDDLQISREHARIFWSENRWFIENKSNGNIVKLHIHTVDTIGNQKTSYRYSIGWNDRIFIKGFSYLIQATSASSF